MMMIMSVPSPMYMDASGWNVPVWSLGQTSPLTLRGARNGT